MSGAEFIAVVGVISNVVSVINFCSRVVDETIAARRRTRDVPKAYESLKAVLPLVQLTLTRTQNRIEAGEVDKATVQPLQPLIKQCGEKVNDLANVFRRMQHEQNSSRFRMLFKSAKNLTQDTKVNTLAESILRDHLLICQHGAAPINSEEIDGIVDKVGAKLDSHIDKLISELKASQSVPANLSLGTANATTQNFQTSSSNVTINGATHIYNVNLVNAQMVDVMKTEYGPVPRVVEGLPHKAIEADAPTTYPLIQKTSVPAVAAVQFESPHLSGIKNTSRVPVIDLDAERNPSTSTNYSSRLPLPHTPLEILHVALVEIREASAGTIDYPGIAKERYKKGLRTLDNVTEQLANGDAAILLRKIHLQTMAYIGLSQVELPSTKHLKRAQQCNDEAFALVSGSGSNNTSLLTRAKLDKAHLKQREARIDERSGMTSKGKIRNLRIEALELYEQVATEMKRPGNCSTMDDAEVLANALVGCGRMCKKTGGGGIVGRRFSAGFGGGNDARRQSVGGPEEYFREAVKVVEEGLSVGATMGEREDDKEALKGVGEGARRAASAGWGDGD